MTDRTMVRRMGKLDEFDESSEGGGFRWAMRTASAVKDQWHSGASPDLSQILETYPGLKNHRTIVVELAYEEYCLRQKAGEAMDPGAFSKRFRSFERSIDCYLAVQSFLDDDPKLAALKRAVTWPEPDSLFLGFNLVRELGRGAAGRVFAASELALSDRLVALKVTVEGCREAEILGRLQHENIVPIYSVQEDKAADLTAFCMPYRGQATLAAVLDCLYAGRRPPRRASAILAAIKTANEGAKVVDSPSPDPVLQKSSYVDGVIHLGVQLAEALAHAHEHGIFHRDLKPSNILMAPEGRPLLLDFNLSVDRRSTVWRIGGTLPYMAPEELTALRQTQACEPHYDARSDLFSLGVVLYELLAGELPFGEVRYDRGPEEIAGRLLKRQAKGPRPLRNRRGTVDKQLAGLVESCLAFDPELRPANAGALACALREQLTLPRRARRWTAAHRGLVLAAAVAVLLTVLGMAAYLALRPPYEVRQFRQGLAYYEAGQDELALQSLNASLAADPRRSDALIARARVYKRRRDFKLAFADYDAADKLDPSPEVAACKGFCLSQFAEDRQATIAYHKALDDGYDAPAVLNNLGYCWLRLGKLKEAEECLLRATKADDSLQPAHHNLVVVYFRRALAGQAMPSAALVHARQAQEIGPESGELFRNLAYFYALAAKQDGALVQPAIACVAKAVEHGIDPRTFKSDPVFSAMEKDAAFQNALVLRGPVLEPVKAVRVIDPAAGQQ
jgi:serine/threonine protein kinase/Tfp pilus assembly protein PilF